MTTIVVFGSSLAVALILILTKTLELKYGSKNILLRFIGKADDRLELIVSKIRFRSLQLIQSIRYIIFVHGSEMFKDYIKKAEQKAVSEFKKRQDVIMGKKKIINGGSVSFYLKKITEEKGHVAKGKIEDPPATASL